MGLNFYVFSGEGRGDSLGHFTIEAMTKSLHALNNAHFFLIVYDAYLVRADKIRLRRSALLLDIEMLYTVNDLDLFLLI